MQQAGPRHAVRSGWMTAPSLKCYISLIQVQRLHEKEFIYLFSVLSSVKQTNTFKSSRGFFISPPPLFVFHSSSLVFIIFLQENGNKTPEPPGRRGWWSWKRWGFVHSVHRVKIFMQQVSGDWSIQQLFEEHLENAKNTFLLLLFIEHEFVLFRPSYACFEMYFSFSK